MARASAGKDTERAIIRGCGNVFADLGFPDAEERQTKPRLAYALNAIVDAQRLTQAAAAARLGSASISRKSRRCAITSSKASRWSG